MSEIYLNDLQKEMVKKAISDGKKCVITHDLMINIIGERIEVTNAHTGDVMRVMNWPEAKESILEKEEKKTGKRKEEKEGVRKSPKKILPDPIIP